MSHRASSKTTRELIELGLSENEALLYEVLLAEGSATVHTLVTRASFSRTMLYHVLKQLMERELVTKRKVGWREIYSVTDPEVLYERLRKREENFQREVATSRTLIPQLKRQYRLANQRPTALSFSGVEECRTALSLLLSDVKTDLCMSMSESMLVVPLEIWGQHERQGIVKKIHRRVLLDETKVSIRHAQKYTDDRYIRCRLVQSKKNTPLVDVILSDTRMLYIALNDKHEPTALMIDNEAFVKTLRTLFESSWRHAKEVEVLS